MLISSLASLRSFLSAGIVTLAVGTTFLPTPLEAAQLSGDARAAVPYDVQQLIVVDYRAMQNSPAAMSLKDRTLPPELKRLETALKSSGLKVDQDADVLTFAAFRSPATTGERSGQATDRTKTVGIAQGQFNTRQLMANWAKQKVKPVMVRNNSIYPMGGAGLSVSFLNQTTMVFGDREAVRASLDARDGIAPDMLSNGDLMGEMNVVDQKAVWSLLDQKGTQTMMKNVLGQAAGLADYDTVKNRMRSSRYTMDFQNGVRFDMAVVMSDIVTAATAATLMKGVVMLKKAQGSPLERSALDDTSIDSNAGTLVVSYDASDSQFSKLLSSPLFQTVVK